MPKTKKDDELTPIQRARKKYNETHAQVQFRVPEDAVKICELYAREGEPLGRTAKRLFLQRVKQLQESPNTEEKATKDSDTVTREEAQTALLKLTKYLNQK